MNANDCFVLDDGEETLFIWHGPQADLDSRALATKVARLYCKRSLAQTRVTLNMRHLESQAEVVSFKAMFPSWSESLQQAPNETFSRAFDPSTVTDEPDAPTVKSGKSFIDPDISDLSYVWLDLIKLQQSCGALLMGVAHKDHLLLR